MRIKFIICCFFFICTKVLAKETAFGYLTCSSTNIGDLFQSIAAKQFLPQEAIAIDRDLISQFQHSSKINTIVNGWFMHAKGVYWERQDIEPPAKSWPPANSIDPFFISVHFTEKFYDQAFSREGIEYLLKHAPIGARDIATLQALEKRGIPSYFSGCLTLTLENSYTERDDIVYIVDLEPKHINYIKAHTQCKTVVLSHSKPILALLNEEQKLKYAESILDLYRKAKCVVSGRLHAAMPCLAFKTPFLLITKDDESRYPGLLEHTWHCDERELLEGKVDYDFNHPPANPTTYLPIRENLIKRVKDWLNTKKQRTHV